MLQLSKTISFPQKETVVELTYLDFSNEFGIVPRGKLLVKMAFSREIRQWVKKGLMEGQHVVLLRKIVGCREVTSKVPQGAILEPKF